MLRKFLNRLTGTTASHNETEFLPAVVEVVETPPSPVGRLVLWTLFILIVGGLFWSIFGTVDEVAIAPGKIIPQGFVKVVQAEDKGIVKNIYVAEGQKVAKGEVLIELDQTVSSADLAQIKKQVAYYTMEVERLTAEQRGMPFVVPANISADQRDIEFQMSLYQSRVADYRNKLAAAEANVAQSQASLEYALANKEKFSGQLEIAVDKEQRIERLLAENAIAYFTLLDQRARRMELAQTVAAQNAEIARCYSAIAQNQEVLTGVKTTWDKEISTGLVNARKELLTYSEELKKAEEKNRLSKIIAPVDGRVTQLAVHTVGGIVTAAQALMEIVPEDTALEVEAWVANKDIGFVSVGQVAEVKVEAFSFQKYGILDGEVINISPDAVEASSEKDKEKNKGYRATLRLNADHVLVKDKPVYLSPGMSVTAEIKIRKKRIIEFFLDPFRQYKNEALRER